MFSSIDENKLNSKIFYFSTNMEDVLFPFKSV